MGAINASDIALALRRSYPRVLARLLSLTRSLQTAEEIALERVIEHRAELLWRRLHMRG